eukprot:4935359-Ditylum_brightwellii.AAC.1
MSDADTFLASPSMCDSSTTSMKGDRYFIDTSIEEHDADFQCNLQHFAVIHSGSTVDNTRTDWFPQVETSP